MEALEAQLKSQEKPVFKPSSELISLRNTEKQLAKLKKFVFSLQKKNIFFSKNIYIYIDSKKQ